MLKRVDVIDAGETSDTTSKHLTVFYTGLYRALLFPRRIDEVNSNGMMVHYSPYDARTNDVHKGFLYCIFVNYYR